MSSSKLSQEQVTALEAFIVQSMSSTTPSQFLTLFSTTLNSAGEWDKANYSKFRDALCDFSFAMGFSQDPQKAVFMHGGPSCNLLDKRFLACLASFAPPDRQAEVRGYETTTKLLAALDSATASRDTTGTLMDLLHQATDLSNNALSGQKASDIVTKLLDLLPAFNRAIPIVPNTMTYADIFLRKHILSVLQQFAGHDTTHKITFGKFLKDAESLFHDGSVNGLIADLPALVRELRQNEAAEQAATASSLAQRARATVHTGMTIPLSEPTSAESKIHKNFCSYCFRKHQGDCNRRVFDLARGILRANTSTNGLRSDGNPITDEDSDIFDKLFRDEVTAAKKATLDPRLR